MILKERKDGIPAKFQLLNTIQIELHLLALVVYADGEKEIHNSSEGLKVGDVSSFRSRCRYKTGNTVFLKANIPVGTVIQHRISKLEKDAQLVRSAGSSAQLMAKEGQYAQVRLPSGEARYVRD